MDEKRKKQIAKNRERRRRKRARLKKREYVREFLGFRFRSQWVFYGGALFGVALALLLFPLPGQKYNEKGETPAFIQMIAGAFSNEKTEILIDGNFVAMAGSKEKAKDAVKQARFNCNKDGVAIIDADVTYHTLGDDEKPKKGTKVLFGDDIVAAVEKGLNDAKDGSGKLAYTMRVEDYTATFASMDELMATLEKVQSKYDTDDSFKVDTKQNVVGNVNDYYVVVKENKTKASKESEQANDNTKRMKRDSSESEEQSTEALSSEEQTKDADVESQGKDDGVKQIGFADKIEIMPTCASDKSITSPDDAYGEMTAENQEASVYVVVQGDALSLIAEKNNMTVDEIKALNPQIESDDDIYYDDRLNITVPKAAVKVEVQKQETYKEKYNADVVYQDDSEMFIGESTVVSEGSAGVHTVTDMVTYVDGNESSREQLAETVQQEAVAEVVKRGTKSRPTYMYPVTNWNLTSEFGYRWGRLHAGCDVGVPQGTTVRASRGGKVVNAGWIGGYGNCVIIDHGDGVCTRYGHLSQVTCSVGQWVDQGQQIALSGNTGRSTGPHLHFEIRINGTAVDPLPYLRGEK